LKEILNEGDLTPRLLSWDYYIGVLISLRLPKGILFLQDNAAPHKAAITHQKLADLHFEVLKHPACSPDFALSDYCLFPNLFIKPKTYQPALICQGKNLDLRDLKWGGPP
jgi:hypothetical protein